LIPFGDESSYTVTPMTTIFDCNLLQHYNSTNIALPLDLFDGRIPNNLLENCSDVIRSFVEEKLLASSSQGCADIIRQPDEFRTAFFTNLVFVTLCLRPVRVSASVLVRFPRTPFVIHLKYKFYPYNTDAYTSSCRDTETALVSVQLAVIVQL